jgi:hypothetical protein
MTNGASNAYTLTTFHGAGDIRTLSPQEIKADILDHTLQDGPVELQAASFVAPPARKQTLLPSEMKSKRKFFASQLHPFVR